MRKGTVGLTGRFYLAVWHSLARQQDCFLLAASVVHLGFAIGHPSSEHPQRKITAPTTPAFQLTLMGRYPDFPPPMELLKSGISFLKGWPCPPVFNT